MPRQTENEKKVVEARHKGVSFSEMNALNKRIAIDQIMFRAAALCGSPLPQTEVFATFIAEEIETYLLNFDYEEYTLAEFLLALQFNANGKIRNPAGDDLEQIQFTGAFINVGYLAKVFNNYKALRNNLDSRLRNLMDGY